MVTISFTLDKDKEIRLIYEPLFKLVVRAFTEPDREIRIDVTIDTRSVTTPFEDWFKRGDYKITAPDRIVVEGVEHEFVRHEIIA